MDINVGAFEISHGKYKILIMKMSQDNPLIF